MTLTGAIRAYVDNLLREERETIMAAIDDLTAITTKLQADFEAYKATEITAATEAAAVAAQKAADDILLVGETAKLQTLDTEIVGLTAATAAKA